ncbi:MAG: hypothetical protein ACYC0T_01255 [Ramlibacter sp.]
MPIAAACARVLDQSVAEVVEAALRRRGTVRAPQPGSIRPIKAPDGGAGQQ